MLTKIIYKNFRSNLKNYILFFLSNIVAIMELFVFYGIRSIIKNSITDKVTAEALKTDFQIAVGIIAVITLMLMFYAMKCYIKLRIKDYSMFRKRLNFRHGYKNPRPHFCNRSTLIIHI